MKTQISSVACGRHLLCTVALGLLLSLAPSHAADPVTADQVTGRWLTASGNLVVEIARCGTPYCGKVVRVLANRSMQNPDVELPVSVASVLGMTILSEFVVDGENAWKGKIYNRENGKTYRCQMSLVSSSELKVRPYVFLPIFGSTQIWHRVPESVGRDG